MPLLATATRPIPKRRKASVRDNYKADPEKKASVRDTYKADPEKKKASVCDSTTQILSLSDLLKGGDMKRTLRRTVLLKVLECAVRLAKCASERTRYRRGHKTTTTTQRYVMACCINTVLTLKSCVCNICTA